MGDRKPDATEGVARLFLEGTYPDMTVEYEPFPSEPPDFLLGGSVGIEVRRLNQNLAPSPWEAQEVTEGDTPQSIGLEQDHYRLTSVLSKCESGISLIGEKRYWLHVDITGPRPLSIEGKQLRTEIARLYRESDGKSFTSQHSGFSLTWEPRTGSPESPAVATGALMDHDAGGWAAEEYQRNLQLVIDEKWKKIERVGSDRYDEWWLVLVDYLMPHSSFLARYDDIRLSLGGFSRVTIIEQNGSHITDYH